VAPDAVEEVKNILLQNGLGKFTVPVGEIVRKEEWVVKVV